MLIVIKQRITINIISSLLYIIILLLGSLEELIVSKNIYYLLNKYKKIFLSYSFITKLPLLCIIFFLLKNMFIKKIIMINI